MPTVQRYGDRKVGTAALPGARLTAAETPDSEGAGLALAKGQTAEAFGRLAGTGANIAIGEASRIAEEQRQRADNIAVLEADNQLSTFENTYLYGDGTEANRGALNRQGKDAMGLPTEAQDEFQKAAGAIQSTLSGKQRDAFYKRVLERANSFDLTVLRHTNQQIDQYESTQLEAKVQNSVNDAITNALDPRRAMASLGDATAAIQLHGKQLGWSQDLIDQKVQSVTSAAHVGIIDRLLANDQVPAAKVYFEETKAQIAGDQLAKVEKAIEVGTLAKQAQTKADEILAAGGTLTEQRDKAKAIDDPKLRDEVTQRLEHEAAVKEATDRDQHEIKMRGVYDLLDKAPNVSRIPPATWAEMSGAERSAARSYAEARVTGTPVKTDLKTYYSLMDLASLKPDQFAATNLLQYRGTLDEGDFKSLTNLQLSLRRQDTKGADGQLNGFRTNTQIWSDTARNAGLSLDSTEAAHLRTVIDRNVTSYEQATGKKADNNTVQQIADDAVTRFVLNDSWLPFMDTVKRGADITVADITPAEKAVLTRQLQASGITPTDEALVYFHKAALRQQGRTR